MKTTFCKLLIGQVLLVALSCQSPRHVEGYGPVSYADATVPTRYDFNDTLGFIGRDTVWHEYIYNGVRTPVEGKVALDKSGKARLLRIGHWKDYDSEGQLLREGQYAIGRYINCCSHGPCSDFYNYRFGEWTFWYPNGQVRARGEFIPRRRNLNTSCRGGDWLWFGEIDSTTWSFWDEDGLPTTPTDEEVRLLERVVFDQDGNRHLITLSRTKRNELVIGDID